MKLDLSIATTTAIFSALWVVVSTYFHLPAWIGFLGCTTYFSVNDSNGNSFIICALSLASGVAWSSLSLFVIDQFNGSLIILFISTCSIAFFMCIQARLKWFAFIPGAFIGACAVFADIGELPPVLTSLFLGLIAGFIMKKTGAILHKLTTNN
ncbi:TPA: DUF1097 domain-containing protein [Klebsiella pneumoniae]